MMGSTKPVEMVEFGEWLHEKLMDSFGIESEAWAIDRVRRVEARLQSQVPGGSKTPRGGPLAAGDVGFHGARPLCLSFAGTPPTDKHGRWRGFAHIA